MIYIVKYEESENNINVGFRKYDFIVYGSIGKELVKGLSKKKVLQRVYEMVKPSIDYETERFDKQLSNSIVDKSDLKGKEKFAPEESKVAEIICSCDKSNISFNKAGDDEVITLNSKLIDQYGEEISGDVVYSSSHGAIEGNTVVLKSIDSPMEVTIISQYNNISTKLRVNVNPYKPVEKKVSNEEIKILALEIKVKNLEKELLRISNEGGGIIV